MAFWDSVLNGVDNVASGVGKGLDGHLKANEAINKIGKFVLGGTDDGLRGFAKNMGESQGLKNSLRNAYTKLGENGTRSLNYKAIAGTYVGAAAAGRIATGGGIYRDKNGNMNLPVVPFV